MKRTALSCVLLTACLMLGSAEYVAGQDAAMVREEMEGVAQLKIPLSIELGVGPTWYDAK